MEESDVLVDWLSQTVGSWQSVVTRDEPPAWIGTQIRIHDLDDK
jgi:hypothetical protein